MHTTSIHGKMKDFEFITTKNQHIRVYISGFPESSSIDDFTRFMKDKDIDNIFCFCEPCDILKKRLESEKKSYYHISYDDGNAPSSDILNQFDKIIDRILKNKTHIVINMHCYSGLGRAPTMLAYLMITRCGLSEHNSIKLIRSKISGAINAKQVSWIIMDAKSNKSNKSTCIVM